MPGPALPLGALGRFDAIAAQIGSAGAEIRKAVQDIANPVGFLSCGSNASPLRMAEKLAKAHSSVAVGLRVSTTAYVPCYGATLSYYGSIPATFAAGGTDAFPFLIVTDARNFEALVASEMRTGNYDLYRSGTANAAISTDIPVYAFLCRFGPLQLDGAILPLREFQSDPEKGVSQRDVVRRVLDRLGYAIPTDALAGRLKDRQFWSILRDRIIAEFGSIGGLDGFERVDLAE